MVLNGADGGAVDYLRVIEGVVVANIVRLGLFFGH